MISSTDNSRVKEIVKIRDNARFRRKQDCFLTEGIRMFREIPHNDLIETFVTPEALERYGSDLEHVSFETVTSDVMKKMSDTVNPQGVLAVVRQRHWTLNQVISGDSPLILLLENLQDPGNVGTIFRVAEGAGVTGIVLVHNCADPCSPKVVRSTMGAIFRMPFTVQQNSAGTVSMIREQGIHCYSADLSGEDFYRYDYSEPTCFFVGNEGNGLSNELSSSADRKIRIPMCGQVESLNAATAATVLSYEALRQRHMRQV